MKQLLLTMVLVLSLVSCSEQEIDMQQLQNRNGLFYVVNEDKPYSGKAVDFYENGQLKVEAVFVDGQQNKILNWLENGQQTLEWNSEHGKKHGIQRVWHINGQIKKESNYKNGDMHGMYRKWDEISGHLTLEYNFVNGDMHGIQRKWDHNGTIQSEYNYKNGDKHGIQREWDNSGQLLVEENYVNGKLTK